jgi:hypothetical protein
MDRFSQRFTIVLDTAIAEVGDKSLLHSLTFEGDF